MHITTKHHNYKHPDILEGHVVLILLEQNKAYEQHIETSKKAKLKHENKNKKPRTKKEYLDYFASLGYVFKT